MPKYDRELIASMLDDLVEGRMACFTKVAIAEQARLLREAENLEVDARTVVLSAASGEKGVGYAEPAPNWCTTCGKHRNDPAAIFCSNAIHQQNAAQGGGEK